MLQAEIVRGANSCSININTVEANILDAKLFLHVFIWAIWKQRKSAFAIFVVLHCGDRFVLFSVRWSFRCGEFVYIRILFLTLNNLRWLFISARLCFWILAMLVVVFLSKKGWRLSIFSCWIQRCQANITTSPILKLL